MRSLPGAFIEHVHSLNHRMPAITVARFAGATPLPPTGLGGRSAEVTPVLDAFLVQYRDRQWLRREPGAAWAMASTAAQKVARFAPA